MIVNHYINFATLSMYCLFLCYGLLWSNKQLAPSGVTINKCQLPYYKVVGILNYSSLTGF